MGSDTSHHGRDLEGPCQPEPVSSLWSGGTLCPLCSLASCSLGHAYEMQTEVPTNQPARQVKVLKVLYAFMKGHEPGSLDPCHSVSCGSE